MKRIAVTQRVDQAPHYQETRDGLDQRLCEWLFMAGLLPVPVPNLLAGRAGALQTWLDGLAIDGLVLSGGNDLGQAPERDASELACLDWAAAQRLPVLAICRGMQVLGLWSGMECLPCEGHVRTRHRLQLAGEGGAREVNSYHQFALAACPNGFDVLASAGDGMIEAIRHRDLPWEGWMWHPEREPLPAREDSLRLRELFK